MAILLRILLRRYMVKYTRYASVCKLIPTRQPILSYTLLNNFHTSIVAYKRRKTPEERKATRIIEYTPKFKGEVVEAWRGITLEELALILNNNVAYVQDLLLSTLRGKNTEIHDVKVLQEAIRRSGRRLRLIGKPVDVIKEKASKDIIVRPPASQAQLKPRPPVVTVMGHVDHGKTTLLDALRQSSVVKQEFGGITQHIGAFSVNMPTGRKITFLDTPGHAAFTAMRARGANVTDIVVLVVAADDGVMEQTIESIKMARDANAPILVAINKIDAPLADVQRTKLGLASAGVQVESLGGDVQAIEVSALKRQNLDALAEALILQADLLSLGADNMGPVEATVVESRMHQHRGKLCTAVVQRGTLKRGGILIAGTSLCRVRALRDADGTVLDAVPPGFPAEIEGWKDLPTAGDLVLEADTERSARAALKFREDKRNIAKQEEEAQAIKAKGAQHQLEYRERVQTKRLMGRVRYKETGPRKKESDEDSNMKTLNVIVKGDVNGTLEAILDTLDTFTSNDLELDLVHYGVGDITENDLELARTFQAIIYAFNVKCSTKLQLEADTDSVDIKHFNVIYKLVDDVKEEINKRMPEQEVENVIGEAQVLQQFEVSDGRKKVNVAGCRCIKGHLKRAAFYKLMRNGQIVFDGNLISMRHLKTEVDTIKKDLECGLQLNNKELIYHNGDSLICYEKKTEQQKTTWDPGF